MFDIVHIILKIGHIFPVTKRRILPKPVVIKFLLSLA